MSTIPIFAVYESTDNTVETSHSFGQVKAGNTSGTDYEVHAWNNKGGSSLCSDIIEATVTVTDSAGTFTGDVVTNTWMEVNVNDEVDSTTGRPSYHPIGGLTKAAIRGVGYAASTDANGGGTISGATNGGLSTDTKNYAKCKFRINLPVNAISGAQSGKIRFEGYYV